MLSPLSNTYRLHESSVSIYQIDASSPEYLIASVVAGAKIQVSPDLLTSNPSYAKNGVPKPIGYDVSLEARRWSFSGNNIKLNNLYVDKKLNIYIRLDATPVTGSTGLIVITPNDYDIDGYFIEKIEEKEEGSAASAVVAESIRTEEDGVEEVLNRPGYRYVMENVGSEEEPDMQKKQKDSDYFYICIGNIYTENGLRKYVIDNGSYNTQYQIDKDKDSNAMFELTKSLSGNHVIRPLMPFLELTIDGTLTIGGVAVNSIINDDQMQKFVKAWNDNKPSDMEDWTLDETIVTTQALITYITYITSHFLRKDAPDATPYALGVGSLVSAGDISSAGNISATGSISSSAKVMTPVIESSNDDKVLYAKDIIDVAKRVVADAVSAHFSNDLALNGKVFIDAEGGMRHADFTPDIITGQRWSLNGLGEGEFESLVLRSFLRVPMLDFNKVTVSSGTSWNAPGCGIIKSVGVGDDGCDFFDIKLERGEIGSFVKGDICMGVWHFEGEDSRLNASDGDAKNDDSGTSVAGFCKVLFMITEVEDYVADGVSYANGRCHVGYRLLDGSAHGHVAESMTVVAYGHDITLDSVPGRLSSEQVNGDNFMFPDELDFMSNERTRSWYKTTKFQRYLVNMNGGTFMHLRDKNNAYVEDDGVSYNDESKYRIDVLDGKRYVFVKYKKSKWDIAFPYNVGMHLGDTTDMYVDDVKTGGKVALSNYSAFLSNVYFYGFLQHIDISQLSDTEGLLASTNYQVDLTSSSATVNVDADGGLQLFDETGRALVQTAVYVHRGDSPMIYIDDFSDAAWSKEAERLGIAEVSEKDKRDYYRLMVAVDGIGSLDSQGALIEGSGYSKEGTSVTVKDILASAVAKGSAGVTFTVLPYKSDVALQKIFFIKFTYDGSVGLSVFTSYVFKRFTWGLSADSIAVPQGGSFTSPLPSTGGWSDSIPEGEGEVWMAQRRFYSDGSEADGGEHANAWVLARMTDTEFLDVEFSAAAEYKPLLYADGTSVHGNSEKALARKKQLGWVEAVDGANAIWMATSHYSDGKWSEWNYVKVKGENGDPGLSVFTSYVFKRFALGTSADSIAVPEGGSFTSPLPDGGEWSDSIPEGEGEVWMAQRRFYSDGSEADGGEHANAWVLARMTDTEFLDVEFSAAANYKPLLYADGSPVHGNSEKALARKKQLGWVEAVDGANAVWMATSHYSDGEWSEWNYVKVKGENGDPGLSVFTSYVFKRFALGTSADSIAVPEGGSFTSPLPSTGGWSDSIPEGEGEVWMAQRRFYSDGSEADGGEHANAWVLARMTDTEFLDVEFSAAANYKPLLYADGTPVHGNSEKALARKKQLGWVEAVDGANAIWMATSHYSDGEWSEWNYVKVKGENGADGLHGADGVSALTASVTPSSIVIDCDSEGRSKEAGSRTFSFHVFDGDSQTESYTVSYGSIASCFQLNASLNKLAWSKGSSIVSASVDISISCKDRTVHLSVPVVANKQGASSLGQLSKMARNRGAFSSLQTYFNNEFWSDYVRVGSSYIFFLGDSVERWDGQEGKYYYKGGSGLATEALYPSASASGDIMDGGRVIWKRVSNVGDLAAGRIIADSINSGNANIGEVFIGKTSTGAVDIQGGVSVDDSADGWLIQSGRIVHTKTGLSLTADGYLDNPDGLHLSVSGSPTNAVLPPSANMLPDPILNNPRHFGFNEVKQAIPVHGIGTTSSDEFYASSLVQTGSSKTFLNFTSPWADDGGRVVSLHFGADYVPSQSKYVYTEYVKSNRVAILTSVPLEGSSDMKQRNIYTFSVWAKNASSDFLFNTLAESRVFVSALGNECSWLYLGIERSASNGGVRTIASGIASEIDGWVQYYVTFEVVFGSSAQSGSATYLDKAYFDWMPYVNAKKKNMYVSYAGAKLEKGDKPTPMTYLSGSLKRAGIDISKGEVVLTADKFLCQNLEGEKTAWLDDTGVFIANGVFTSPVNIIDWNNNVGRDKIIVAFKDADGNFLGYLDNNGNDRSMSGEIVSRDDWDNYEIVVYLDVLRLGDTVKILSLPADAIGSGGTDKRFLEFPYYIDDSLNCRTLTRFNGKSDSVPRLVKADEMRMLGGKRITLLLNNAVSTPYTLAQCFFLSYASSRLSSDLQTANATYVYKYPTNGMIYDDRSGMGLNGIRVVTLECRSAFFYDDKGNKSCYGYAWVSSRDETLSEFDNSGLDSWT